MAGPSIRPRRLHRLFLLTQELEQQPLPGQLTVLQLGALLAAAHGQASGQMSRTHCCLHLVHVLAAVAPGAAGRIDDIPLQYRGQLQVVNEMHAYEPVAALVSRAVGIPGRMPLRYSYGS